MSKEKTIHPLPLFPKLSLMKTLLIDSTHYIGFCKMDYEHAKHFLESYQGSEGTFNSYRREIERFLHWTWCAANTTLQQLKRQDLEAFIHFCEKPTPSWIGLKKAPRFIEKEGQWIPNPQWRPFVASVSKSAFRKGERPNIQSFDLSTGAIKQIFAILGAFFNYLLQEEYVDSNPVALIRQKSQFIRKKQGTLRIRRLSELQWEYVITTARKMAEDNPAQHERTLFIMSALYSMYLRISELAASLRWTPCMNDFIRDHDDHWWFITVGKGNKERQIAVSDAMLEALKRWRLFLGRTPFPTPADQSPLLPKTKSKEPLSSTTYIRRIVQTCFDRSIEVLAKDGFVEESEALLEATVHWLRHTGISEDIKHRPRDHVREDAGHASGATTDQYIDIESRERHRSAKHKLIFDEKEE